MPLPFLKNPKAFFIGRKKINQRRNAAMERNIYKLMELIDEDPNLTQKEMGKRIGVAQSTINKYLKMIKQMGYCPCCHQLIVTAQQEE